MGVHNSEYYPYEKAAHSAIQMKVRARHREGGLANDARKSRGDFCDEDTDKMHITGGHRGRPGLRLVARSASQQERFMEVK